MNTVYGIVENKSGTLEITRGAIAFEVKRNTPTAVKVSDILTLKGYEACYTIQQDDHLPLEVANYKFTNRIDKITPTDLELLASSPANLYEP